MKGVKYRHLPYFNICLVNNLKKTPTLQALEYVTNAYYIKWQLVKTQTIPDNFPSRWLWNVISWIQAAITKVKNTPHYKKMTFDEILSHYDPGLDIVARHSVRQLIELETEQDTLRFYPWSQLILAWLHYMAIEVGINFNFLKWAKEPPFLDKDRLEATLSRDPRKDYTSLLKANKLLDAFHSNSQPKDSFRSRALWALSNKVWIDSKGEFFHCCFLIEQDPVLARSILPVFLEVFGADFLELFGYEFILFELWTDKILRDKQVTFDWRKALKNFYDSNPDFFQIYNDGSPESSGDSFQPANTHTVKKYPDSYHQGR